MGSENVQPVTALLSKTERDALVVKYLPLAYKLAKEEHQRKRLRGYSKDDLRQEASIAMIQCAARFDPSRGAFPTFAEQAIKWHFNHLAARTPDGVDAVESPTGTPARTRIMPNRFEAVDLRTAPVDQAVLLELLQSLPARERQAMQHYLDGYSGKEIGAAMGISGSRANAIIRSAKDRIAKKLDPSVPPNRSPFIVACHRAGRYWEVGA